MMNTPTNINRSLIVFTAVFCGFYIISFPFPYYLLPTTGEWLKPITEPIIRFTYQLFFEANEGTVLELTSDSTGHYFYLAILFFLALTLTFILQSIFRKEINYKKIYAFLIIVLSYYLATQLLSYGLNKIFKWQFYSPEPNTLFTRVGDLNKDILFWTSMGSSYSYSFFAGLIEVIPAILLLFSRTRFLGGLISFAVLINVVMINFGFDISVKLHSLFLLFCSGIILSFYKTELKSIVGIQSKNVEEKTSLALPYKKGIKVFFILWIVADALFPYIKTGNFNDDKYTKYIPKFHGAYLVAETNDAFLDSEKANYKVWNKIFIHRKNYFIVQFEDESMMDYVYEEDLQKHQLKLTNYYNKTNWILKYSYNQDSTLLLKGIVDSIYREVSIYPIEWKKMNLLKDEFHWRMDE